MDGFRAEELRGSEGRGVRLVYQSGDTSRVILLKVINPIGNQQRYPFAFQCDEPAGERHYPLIRIVAAPGVSVVLKSFPRTWVERSDTPAFQVTRVQDPELIPPMAMVISTAAYCGREEISPPPDIEGPLGSYPGASGPDHFIIRREPRVEYMDTYIRHPYTGTLYRIRVPAFTWNESENPDAKARFAYYIDPDGRFGSVDRPLLKIVMAGSVEFKFKQTDRQPDDPPETRRRLGFLRAFQLGDFYQVPVQRSDGSAWPLNPERPRPERSVIPGPRSALDAVRDSRTWYEAHPRRDPSLREEIVSTVIDISVGFVPIVGDAVDIGELAYGLLTGEDRWGRTLGVGDKVLMGVGAVLPFVSGSALRAAGNLSPLFGRRAGEFAELIEQLRQGPWSDGDKRTLAHLEQLLKRGVRLSNVQAQQLLSLMNRAHLEYPAIASLLNASRTGFAHTQLQATFRRHGRRGEDPVQWALRERGAGALRVLRFLFGEDLRKAATRTVRRLIDLAAIARPEMSVDKADRLLRVLLQHPDKLFDRLGPLLRRIRARDQETSAFARAFLDEGLFRILKGNIGEILSLDKQFEILREIQTGAGGWRRVPGARLFTGVRVRLMQHGQLRSPLFSDNIIAVIKTRRVTRNGQVINIPYMQMLAVFEVKSGYEGGPAVQRQIFRWVEERIDMDAGSELVLPQGHRILDGRGGETALDMS